MSTKRRACRVHNHHAGASAPAVWRHAHQFTRPELVGEVATVRRDAWRAGLAGRLATL